jgi:hypothetical protein
MIVEQGAIELEGQTFATQASFRLAEHSCSFPAALHFQ